MLARTSLAAVSFCNLCKAQNTKAEGPGTSVFQCSQPGAKANLPALCRQGRAPRMCKAATICKSEPPQGTRRQMHLLPVKLPSRETASSTSTLFPPPCLLLPRSLAPATPRAFCLITAAVSQISAGKGTGEGTGWL